MTLFVDTSALYAVLDLQESHHERAVQVWDDALAGARLLRTNSYVLSETAALVQSRLGMEGARVLHLELAPALSVRFIDDVLHSRAVTALLLANRRSVSLVDWTSFEQMRTEGLAEAFAFDGDFEAQGFSLLPNRSFGADSE